MIHRIAIAVLLVVVALPLHAASYTLEPDYTQGVFHWNHLGFSSPAAQFAQGQGTLEFDPADVTHASVKVTIPLSTLSTGVPGLDEDFRSKTFFDTARYPAATFTSTRVEKGGAPDRLKVTGDLEMHGVTRPITLDVRFVKLGLNPRTNVPTVGFDGTTTLKRSAFGLGKYVPQVGDDIELRITVQGAEAKAYAEYLKAQAEKEARK